MIKIKLHRRLTPVADLCRYALPSGTAFGYWFASIAVGTLWHRVPSRPPRFEAWLTAVLLAGIFCTTLLCFCPRP
jgi:hypothetical protein